MKNATFRQLRVFNEVARHLSFARAAEALHLTPPAVTMQVKELEGHVGLPLFERAGKKITLTTAGEYMLVYARRILATVKDAEDAAARLQRAETGVLTIGFVSTAKYFMMKLIADFRRLPRASCKTARSTSPSWAARPRKCRPGPNRLPRTRMCSWPAPTIR